MTEAFCVIFVFLFLNVTIIINILKRIKWSGHVVASKQGHKFWENVKRKCWETKRKTEKHRCKETSKNTELESKPNFICLCMEVRRNKIMKYRSFLLRRIIKMKDCGSHNSPSITETCFTQSESPTSRARIKQTERPLTFGRSTRFAAGAARSPARPSSGSARFHRDDHPFVILEVCNEITAILEWRGIFTE